jgi:altronate dehydratase
MNPNRVLVLHTHDNVAVALTPLAAGETVAVTGSPLLTSLAVRETIPVGHKVALCALPEGATVVKYGQPIGTVTHAIGVGEHVHTHNVVSARAG